MRRNKNYYEFSNYIESSNNTYDKTNKIRIFIIVVIIILFVGLILIAMNIEQSIEISTQEQIYVGDLTENSQTVKDKTKQDEEKIEEQDEQQEQEETEIEAKLPQLTDEGRSNIESIYHSETKRAFLTFDDGPSSNTKSILETLKNENIKATFFMLGTRVEAMPETVKEVYDEGHYIANHGYSHEYSSVYSSVQSVLDEYNKCNTAVQNAIGQPEYNSHLFRFPGGLSGGKYAELKQEAKNLLNENDILNVDWNALSGDAESQNPSAEDLMQKIKDTTQGKSSVVILMHDAQAKKVTAEILPEVIAYLREQGYEFKSFYDIIK